MGIHDVSNGTARGSSTAWTGHLILLELSDFTEIKFPPLEVNELTPEVRKIRSLCSDVVVLRSD